MRKIFLCLLVACFSLCLGLSQAEALAKIPPGSSVLVVEPGFAGRDIALSDCASRLELAHLLVEPIAQQLQSKSRLSVQDFVTQTQKTEDELKATGGLSQNDAIALGRQAGVDYVAYGDIIGFGLERPENESLVGYSYKITMKLQMTLRLIDVKSGRIVGASHGSGESSLRTEWGAFAPNTIITGSERDNDVRILIGDTLNQAADDAVNGLITQLGIGRKK